MWVILSKDIDFIDLDGSYVVFKKDTPVFVDLSEMIAFYKEFHFDIHESEFVVIN